MGERGAVLPGREHEQAATESRGPLVTGWHLPLMHSKSSGHWPVGPRFKALHDWPSSGHYLS